MDGAATQSQIVHVNGKPGVLLFVARQPDANTIEVVNAVRAALPNLTGIPKGVTLTLSFDQSQYIRAAISTLAHEALIGALLTFLVVLVFLRSLWSVFIVSIGIPLSVSTALLLLYFSGQTFNIFTLGGLTLAIGRLVDDAIVVRENITRHLSVPGTPVLQAVINATQEVGLPVFASTSTTCAVFFPVVFLSGIAQRLFVPMALTVIFALIASYVVSMTIDPLLSLRVLRTSTGKEIQGEGLIPRVARLSERTMERIDEHYQRVLRWTLGRGPLVLGVIAAVFVLSVVAARGIGSEFFPATDESQFSIKVQGPQGTAVQATTEIVEEISQIVRQTIPKQYVVAVYSNTGVPANGGFGSNAGPNYGDIDVRLVSPTHRPKSSDDYSNDVRRAIGGRFPGVLTFIQTGGLEHSVVNFGSAAPIDIQLLGYDQTVGVQFAQQVAAMVTAIPGTADVQITPRGVDPGLQRGHRPGEGGGARAEPDPGGQRGEHRDLRQRVDGEPVHRPDHRERVQPGRAAAVTSTGRSPEDLGSVPLNVLPDPAAVDSPPQASVPILLRDVAQISLGSTPLQINRKNEQRVIDVTANVVDRPLGAVSDEIAANLNRTPFPVGFTYHLAGQTEAQSGAFSSLGFAMIMALMLVYMIMASQFQSLVDPFVIMFTVPLGFIGVIWMLLLTHTTLSIISFMGVIMMIGIVVSNGILLVDYANKQQKQGMSPHDAIIRAGRIRLRPILMTAIATVCGMIPMALGLGEGAETNMPLARAVIGGLSVSTLLTLLVIPLMYLLFEEHFPRRRQLGQD